MIDCISKCAHCDHLLHAADNKQVTVSHERNGGIPAPSVHTLHNLVCLAVWVKHSDSIQTNGQKVSIQVEIIAYR